MERFIVSARKYRPQNFSTVVGQSHITTTLKNAIRNNQLAHAFLFCGPRGVGKTTCARILAKTINCENLTTDGEACNQCHSCVAFNEGISLNIHELDAASNNSVDDIRSLVEQVRFAPQAGKYKVYIVDEVHMLSASAFNAFLKTLEEPPPYAIFILATTEKHKILPTILSRCQIFDFKRITTNDTVEHLREICDKEEIKAEPAALHVIAQKSEGCMRDALSILDKIVSFTNGELTYTNTLEHLNILDADYYFRICEAMLKQDVGSAMLIFDDINKKGFEGDLVLDGFSEFFRNMLVCKDPKMASLLEVVDSFRDRYISFANEFGIPFTISALNVLNEAEINYKGARNKRLHVELVLIRLCYLQQALSITAEAGGQLDKKKQLDTVKPLSFRKLQPIEFKTAGTTNQPVPKKTTAPIPSQYAQEEAGAILSIETYAARPATTAEPVTRMAPPLEPVTAAKSGRFTSLEKIQKDFAKANQHSVVVASKALDMETLQYAWNEIAVDLKANKNPAYSSFELAVLRIKDDCAFDVITPNNLQQKFIEQEKMKVSEILQALFCNRALTFSVIVEHNADLNQKIDAPMNNREMYQKIVEQYPLVKELRDRLKLELDY